MSHNNFSDAWTDIDYRPSLSETEWAVLQERPAGMLELAEEDLANAMGGFKDKIPDSVGPVAPDTGCPELQTCRWSDLKER
jgi:mersacidin/lichenicidin family type 2 lantibiotic